MERFYPFFGHTLKRDIDLLRFLYLQKRFVPIEEIGQALAFGCQTRLGVILYWDEARLQAIESAVAGSESFFLFAGNPFAAK